jgi:hypothetical protein
MSNSLTPEQEERVREIARVNQSMMAYFRQHGHWPDDPRVQQPPRGESEGL